MSSKLLVIKLGGAVITDKDSFTPKIRIAVIKNISRQIRQLIDAGYKIVLVHGAGYVHHAVKQYKLHHRLKSAKPTPAVCLAIDSIISLNLVIIKQLLRAQLKPIQLSPHTFIIQSASKLKKFNISIIRKFLEQGFIPILHADIVLDDLFGLSILSGDTIACYLAKKIKADQVIFLSDVDGVYTSNPRKKPSAKLIPKITNRNFNQVLKGLTPTNSADISGEMRGKILQIKRYLSGIPTFITNGQNPKVLAHLVNGDPIGTRLLFP